MKSKYAIVSFILCNWSLFASHVMDEPTTYVSHEGPQQTGIKAQIPAGAQMAGEEAAAQAAGRKPVTRQETFYEPLSAEGSPEQVSAAQQQELQRKSSFYGDTSYQEGNKALLEGQPQLRTVSETSGVSSEPKFLEAEEPTAAQGQQPEPVWQGGSYDEAMQQATEAARTAATQYAPQKEVPQQTQAQKPQTTATKNMSLLNAIKSAPDVPSAIKAAIDVIKEKINQSQLISSLKTKTTAFLKNMLKTVSGTVDQKVEKLPTQYSLPREYTTDEGIQSISKSKQLVQQQQKKATDDFQKFKKSKGWEKLVTQVEKNPVSLTIDGEQVNAGDALRNLENGSLTANDIRQSIQDGYTNLLKEMNREAAFRDFQGTAQEQITEMLYDVNARLSNPKVYPMSDSTAAQYKSLYSKYNAQKGSLDNASSAVSLYGKNTPYFKDYNNKINSAQDAYRMLDDVENNLQLEKILTGVVPVE